MREDAVGGQALALERALHLGAQRGAPLCMRELAGQLRQILRATVCEVSHASATHAAAIMELGNPVLNVTQGACQREQVQGSYHSSNAQSATVHAWAALYERTDFRESGRHSRGNMPLSFTTALPTKPRSVLNTD